MYTPFLLFLSVVTLVDAQLVREGVHELAQQMSSKYNLVAVTQLEGNCPTDSLSTHQSSGIHKNNATFHLRIRNHDNAYKNASEWILDLKLNIELVVSNFRFYSSEGESSGLYQHCYYHGNVRGLLESSVSLSTCGHGIKGFIFDGTDLYHLEHYGSDGEHFLFRSEDMLGVGGTCGVEGGSHGVEFGQNLLRNKRAQANKFIEFYLVMDNAHFQLTGSNTTYSRQYAIEIANHMDFIYRSIGIRIALVGAEVWSTTDFIATNGDLNILLENWLRYLPNLKRDKARDGVLFDNSHIITGLSNSQSNVIGKAPLNTMCLSGSGGVNRDIYGNLATGVATTLCHEMGHNLGMNHDEGRSCNDCPDSNRGCVMNAVIRSPSPFLFTTCSRDDLHSALSSGVGTCIYNLPSRLFTDPICGNAFVEEGEECDCGSDSECPQIDPCCQPGTCKLYSWAECGSGDCCNNCTYSKRDMVCRAKTGDCDIEEKCSGSASMCPDNLFRRNGLECRSGGESSFCYEGACKTLLDQCHYVWGTGALVAADICFDRVNVLGNEYGYCTIDERGSYTACLPSNVKCGKLHCAIPLNSSPVLIGDYTITYYQYTGALCTAISISISDMPDPGLVPDGTICDTESVCYMGVCTNISQLPYTPCPVGSNGLECSGLAECSNTGVCVGLPDRTAGGSTAVVAVSIVSVLIVVSAFSVSGLLIAFWLFRKRYGSPASKPATSSGLRLRGSSLSEIVTAKLGSLPRYKNLAQSKTSVNTSQPSTPPKPPKPSSKPSGDGTSGPRGPPPSRPPPRMKPSRPAPPPSTTKPKL